MEDKKEASYDTTGIGSEDIESGSVDEIRRTREIQNNKGFLRSMRRMEEWMDSKVGVELQGVDRIPEEEKQPPSIINAFLMWWSLNVHVGVIPLGVLGPEFGLSLKQTVAASIVGTVLGYVRWMAIILSFE